MVLKREKKSHFCYSRKILKFKTKREMTVMDLITFAVVEQINQESLEIDAASLYRAFEQVKDGRGKKGIRYPLALILTLIMLGKMVGQTKIEGTINWIDERKRELRKLLNWPKRFPSRKAYTTALAKCDDQEIIDAIKQVILKARAIRENGNSVEDMTYNQTKEGEKLVHTAMDGKTMRGTLNHEKDDQPSVHLLALYEVESGIVIAQETVKSKENEITAAKKFLDPIYVKGRIISTDAMHTQKKWCAGVDGYGGYYLVIAKENQPTVYEDLHDYFEDQELIGEECEYYKKVQKGHGRLETREIWLSTYMSEWFAKDWAGIAQVFMIRRVVIEGIDRREKIAYGLTNLSREQANAEQILYLNQKHWSIENRLHYRRDVTLGEDASQVSVRGVPSVIAALNGGILALSDFLGVKNLAKQMVHYCAQPQEALQLLLGNLSRQNGGTQKP
jgi:predicted transposase YbfD/YdcC